MYLETIETIQIYQKGVHSFYYINDPVKMLTEKTIKLNPLGYSYIQKAEYEKIYEVCNKSIDSTLEQNDIQINNDEKGIAQAVICAFLLYKGLDFESAMETMVLLQVQQPNIYFLSSLKNYEKSMFKQNNGSIISLRDNKLQENDMIQSEIINFPIFSSRLIESSRSSYSQILGSEYQAESQIVNQYPSTITFGGGNSMIVCEEPKINSIHSSIATIKK